MDKQVHKCPARVYSTSGYHSHQCSKTASHEHKGVMYCKTHHPPTVQAKRAQKQAEWDAQYQGRRNALKAEEEKRAEQKRRADCFPELLEALQAAVELADKNKAVMEASGYMVTRSAEMQAVYDQCVAAIAIATGEQQ